MDVYPLCNPFEIELSLCRGAQGCQCLRVGRGLEVEVIVDLVGLVDFVDMGDIERVSLDLFLFVVNWFDCRFL